MSNLLELAVQATKNNISKSGSSRKSISDSLFEMLYGPKSKPMTKIEVVGVISLERLQNESETEVTTDNFNSDEIQKLFKRITKTVSNGFDTAVCAGKTTASFCSNKKYMDLYEVVKLDSGQYTIQDKITKNKEEIMLEPGSKQKMLTITPEEYKLLYRIRLNAEIALKKEYHISIIEASARVTLAAISQLDALEKREREGQQP